MQKHLKEGNPLLQALAVTQGSRGSVLHGSPVFHRMQAETNWQCLRCKKDWAGGELFWRLSATPLSGQSEPRGTGSHCKVTYESLDSGCCT